MDIFIIIQRILKFSFKVYKNISINIIMKEFKINNLKNIPLNIIEGTNINNPKAIIINIHGISSHFQELYYSEDCIRFETFFNLDNLKVWIRISWTW